MKKTWTRLAGIGLADEMAVPLFASRAQATGTMGGEPTQMNEERALTLSPTAFDQLFTPFFATSLYDTNTLRNTLIDLPCPRTPT